MQFCQIKKRDKFLTNMEKKVSIPVPHQNSNKINEKMDSKDTTMAPLISI